MICRVPVRVTDDNEVTLCSKKFYPGEERAYQTHVARCGEKHADEIRETSVRNRLDFLDPESHDMEVGEHFRKVGQRMKQEGRLTMHDHEKAGG